MVCWSVILSILAAIITIQRFYRLMMRGLSCCWVTDLLLGRWVVTGHIVGSRACYFNSAVLSSDDPWARQSVNLTVWHELLAGRILSSRYYYCNWNFGHYNFDDLKWCLVLVRDGILTACWCQNPSWLIASSVSEKLPFHATLNVVWSLQLMYFSWRARFDRFFFRHAVRISVAFSYILHFRWV